eukprot:4156453-Prorocentrum_lima.AAC.1
MVKAKLSNPGRTSPLATICLQSVVANVVQQTQNGVEISGPATDHRRRHIVMLLVVCLRVIVSSVNFCHCHVPLKGVCGAHPLAA